MRDHFAAVGRGEQRAFGVAIGIVQSDAQHETVELRIGQRIRAGEIERILRRHDEERRSEFVRDAVGGDLLFGHRFEQRALRLRRGAVDFVGEHELREQRARMELELAGVAVVNADADDVRRQQVAR